MLLAGDGNYVKIDRCNFTENSGLGTQNDFGAAIALTYLGLFSQRIASTRHEITDRCMATDTIHTLCYYLRVSYFYFITSDFIRNKGPNGIFNVGYAPILLSGKNRFMENDGASLRVRPLYNCSLLNSNLM